MEALVRPPRAANRRLGVLAIVFLIAATLIGLTTAAWRSIHPGYVGIVFDKANHAVTTGALEPGWAFINPCLLYTSPSPRDRT